MQLNFQPSIFKIDEITAILVGRQKFDMKIFLCVTCVKANVFVFVAGVFGLEMAFSIKGLVTLKPVFLPQSAFGSCTNIWTVRHFWNF